MLFIVVDRPLAEVDGLEGPRIVECDDRGRIAAEVRQRKAAGTVYSGVIRYAKPLAAVLPQQDHRFRVSRDGGRLAQRRRIADAEISRLKPALRGHHDTASV